MGLLKVSFATYSEVLLIRPPSRQSKSCLNCKEVLKVKPYYVVLKF